MKIKFWQPEHKPRQLAPDSETPCSWGKAPAFEESRHGRAVGHTDCGDLLAISTWFYFKTFI